MKQSTTQPNKHKTKSSTRRTKKFIRSSAEQLWESKFRLWTASRPVFILLLVILGFNKTYAQITVSGASNAKINRTYTSLTGASPNGAFAAIDSLSESNATITITITASESNETGANALTGKTLAWTSLTIRPSGGAWTISGAVAGPLITLSSALCTNVTIDGLNTGGNSLTIANTSTSSSAATIELSAAPSNTIQNCTIEGAGASPANIGTLFITTSGTTGCTNTKIQNNTITTAGSTLPYIAIFSVGFSTAIYNSGTIQNNNIQDYFNPAGSSYGVYLSSNNQNWTIRANNFFQSATRTMTSTGGAIRGIFTNGSLSATTTLTISNNIFGYGASNQTGTMTYAGSFSNTYAAIDLSSLTTTNTVNIDSNTIAAISFTTTATGQVFSGISASTGIVNIGVTKGNNIGTSAAAISVTGVTNSGQAIYGIYDNTSSASAISNNVIQNINTGGAAGIGYTFNGIYLGNPAARSAISNNNIGAGLANSITIGTNGTTNAALNVYGIQVAGSNAATVSGNHIDTMYAWSNGGTTAAIAMAGILYSNSAANALVSNNVINFLTATGANSGTYIEGIYFTGGASGGADTISGNTVEYLSSNAPNTTASSTISVSGIDINASNTFDKPSVYQNTIHDLSNSYASTAIVLVDGIHWYQASGQAADSAIISQNFIYSLSANNSNTSAILTGINFSTNTVYATVSNNIIQMGIAAGNSITGAMKIFGIQQQGTSNYVQYIFNSVYVGGTGVGTTANNTFAFSDLSIGSSNQRYILNNIFVNARSNASTGGSHYAVTVGGSGHAPTDLNENYNDYLASGTGGVFGFFNSANVTSLANWQFATYSSGKGPGLDANSINADPSYLSPSASTPDFHPGASTCDATGTAAWGISTDYYGTSRASNTPTDMGAIAFQTHFTSGDIAVLIAAASASNTTANIVELNSTTAGQSGINTYSIAGTGGSAMRFSGSATSTGYLATSNDGTLLAFTGGDTTSTSANINTVINRGIGTLNNSLTFNVATNYQGVSGNNTRCATSLDRSTWKIGDQGGIYTNSATSASPSGNVRSVKAFGGTIYVLQSSNTSLAAVDTINATPALVGLPGLGNSDGNEMDFYLISSGSNGSTYDILYTIENTNATSGTIHKYSLVSGSWASNGTKSTSFGGYGIAAAVVPGGGSAYIYITGGDGGTAATSITKLTDAAGYNASINITNGNNVTLYTAGASAVLKGIAFAPTAPVVPLVTTKAASSVGSTTASSGGNVTSDGGATVTRRGLIYSTGTITDSTSTTGGGLIIDGGTGTGSYTASLTGLSQGVTYHTKAFAVNSVGVSYGSDQTFTTCGVSASITSQTNVNCYGNSTGAATVTATGNSPFTYSWSPGGSTSSSITGLSAQTYTVTVTATGGCTTTATAAITQPSAVLAANTASTGITCTGSTNGSVSSSPTGGTSSYTYSWSPGGSTSSSITSLGYTGTTYTVTVTDAKGCTATGTATVATAPTPSVTVTNNCGNSTLSTTTTGTLLWNTGATTSSITVTVAGTYSVTANGCSAPAGTGTAVPFLLNNPSPYALSGGSWTLTGWSASAAAGSYPGNGATGSNATTGVVAGAGNGNMIFHWMEAGTVDPTLHNNPTATEDYALSYNQGSSSRVDGFGNSTSPFNNGGIGFINTGSGLSAGCNGNLGEAVLALNSTARTNIQISWVAYRAVNNTSHYKLRGQYRVGASGNYTDLPNTGASQIEFTSNGSGSSAVSYGPITLPSACENQSVVQIRWVYYFDTGSGSRDEIALTNITVSSSAASAPSLITATPSAVASTTATSGGNVTAANGATVTRRGLVYSTGSITDSTSTTGGGLIIDPSTGTGSYSASLTGLSQGTLYHTKAFALNSVGVSYGSDSTFTTYIIPTVTAASLTGTVGVSFSYQVSATQSPTAYADSGSLPGGLSLNPTTGVISGTPTTAGNFFVFITATNAGGTSTSVMFSFAISPGTQTITFAPLAEATAGIADFSPGATASSGLTVSYTSSNTSVVTIVSGNIHIVGVGISTITASQAGNANYLAAASVSQVQAVIAAASSSSPTDTDIIFTQVSADNDGFEFMTLKRLNLATLEFTNNGICSNTLFRLNEINSIGTNVSAWTDVPAGTFVRILMDNSGSNGNNSFDGTLHYVDNNSGSLSTSGEQIICYTGTANGGSGACGGSGTNTYISGINWGNSGWLTTGTPNGFTSYAPGTPTDFTISSGSHASFDVTGSITGNVTALTTGMLNASNWDHYTASTGSGSGFNSDVTLKSILFNEPDYSFGALTLTANSGQMIIDWSGITWSGTTSSTRYIVVVNNSSSIDNPVDEYTCYVPSTVYGSAPAVVKAVSGQSANNTCGTTTAGNGSVVYLGYSTSTTVTGLTAGSTYYVKVYAVNGNGPDANFSTTPASGNQIIKATQTITFNALPDQIAGSSPVTLTATASSGLTVSYSSSNTSVATASGSTLTIVGAGQTTITASQSGNSSYDAAAPVSQIQTVIAAPSTAVAGDILFTQVSADNDGFEFMTLKRLNLSNLKFTNNGICSNGLFRLNEINSIGTNVSAWTDIPAGTLVRILMDNSGTNGDNPYDGTLHYVDNNPNSLSANGEQIICYTGTANGGNGACGGSGTNTYISGINWGPNGGWLTSGTPTGSTSYAPGTPTDFSISVGSHASFDFTSSITGNASTLLGVKASSGIIDTANWSSYTAGTSFNSDVTLKTILYNEANYSSGALALSSTSGQMTIDWSGITWTTSATNSNTRYMVVVYTSSSIDNAVDRYTCYVPNSIYSSAPAVIKSVATQTHNNPCGTPTTGNGYVVYLGYGTSATVTGLAVGSTYYAAVFAVNGNGYDANFSSTPVTGNQTITNTITTGAVTGSPFCSGATGITVPFSYGVASNFTSGVTVFTAQLSNASGNFSSPTTLQSITSDGSGNQSISVTIPSTISTGSAYRVRVVSNSPAINGSDNGANLIINGAPTVTDVDNCGSSTLTAANYTGTLSWSNSATTSSITVTAAGTYSVTQTVGGCTTPAGTATAAPKSVPSAPSVSVTNNCGSSVLSTTATGTLLWSNSATSSAITVTSSGAYTVTTTNGSNCTSTAGSGTAAPLTVPSAPSVSVTNNCGNSVLSTTATGTLLWSNSATSSAITVTSSGAYTVTTTNGSNCTSTAGSGTAAPLTVPSAPSVSVTNNCGNSVLSTTATGTLLWSNSATTSAITVTASGAYTVTTTNGSNCTSTAGSGTAAPLTVPSAPSVSVSNNCGNSVLSTTATGTLLWSNSATSSAITVTSSGAYTVTTTNGSNCTSTAGSGTAAPLTVPSAPSVSITNNCSGSSVLSTTATGTLAWSTGASTSSITVTASGTYSVTATVGTCTSSAGAGTASPGSTPSGPSVFVVNNCNGSSTLSTTATGGGLLWSTGATTSAITVTAAGTYSVTQTTGSCTSAAGTGVANLASCNFTFTVKFFIQGYYMPGNGTMSPLLKLLGLSPNATDVDTATIELHSTSSPATIVDSYKGILQSNGNLICTFAGSDAGNSYYIVIKHHNSIATWSSSGVTVSSEGNYNFTTGAGQAYYTGTAATVNVGGVYCIYSGDVNQDGSINSSDKQAVQSALSSFVLGSYNANDLNGDASVDAGDLRLIRNNGALSLSVQHP